jgi:glutamate/tyrosine decarboxylase-like PLP-dependent enzyme
MTMPKQSQFPIGGLGWSELRQRMMEMRHDDVDWRNGRAALHVYYPGDDVLDVARQAYAMFMCENALAPAAFPSLARMERDIINATCCLFRAQPGADGNVTLGGTESILLAMKAARDWSRGVRSRIGGVPEVVMPRTVHPAFDKAAQFLGLNVVKVPVGPDYRACPDRIANALTARTVMLVASAPCFPYGTIDPVDQIARIAVERGIWLHVDACIGGFIAPFAKKLGYDIPDFDFSLPGVCSISADLHKYGYAPKGASVILYSNAEFHKFQTTEFSDWPKGKYFTPTVAGTRPGGALAAAWAVMHYLGEVGYTALTCRVMKTWRKYLSGVSAIPSLCVVGQPHVAIVSFTSEAIDMPAVARELSSKKWYISRIAEPPGIHQVVSLAHEEIVEKYLGDLRRATTKVGKARTRVVCEPVVTY